MVYKVMCAVKNSVKRGYINKLLSVVQCQYFELKKNGLKLARLMVYCYGVLLSEKEEENAGICLLLEREKFQERA